jgi:hypothetical protein
MPCRIQPLMMQLSLLLPAPRVVTLASEERANVIAVLARLLLEAARSTPVPEDADDVS